MAIRVSIAQLKARLSEFLGVVGEGEDVIVTDRGRPVARITRLAGQTGRDARTDALIRAGLAMAPLRRLGSSFFSAKRPPDPEGLTVDFLLQERAEGV